VRALPALTCLVALALIGCGDKPAPKKPVPPEQQVRAVIASFQTATQKKDYRRLCTQVLAQELLDKIRRANLPCEQAVKVGLQNVVNPRIAVQSVEVTHNRAVAQVRSSADNQPALDGTLALIREVKGWKVATLGTQGP
jgi:hypothetical protein